MGSVMMTAAGVLLGLLGVALSVHVLWSAGLWLAVMGALVAFTQDEWERKREVAELRGKVEALDVLGDEVTALREEVASLRGRG